MSLRPEDYTVDTISFRLECEPARPEKRRFQATSTLGLCRPGWRFDGTIVAMAEGPMGDQALRHFPPTHGGSGLDIRVNAEATQAARVVLAQATEAVHPLYRRLLSATGIAGADKLRSNLFLFIGRAAQPTATFDRFGLSIDLGGGQTPDSTFLAEYEMASGRWHWKHSWAGVTHRRVPPALNIALRHLEQVAISASGLGRPLPS
jgi:hypothetical protein